jgi:hypothetical protein
MRKGICEGEFTFHFDLNALEELQNKGYRYVQIKGLTLDKHYDYISPHFIVLVPIKELPSNQAKKDIYEPIESEILQEWAKEIDNHVEIVIANKF